METESTPLNHSQQPVDTERLRLLAREFRFDEATYQRALQLSGLQTNQSKWIELISRFLMIYAVTLMIAGIASFFAYNWSELDRFAKFGLLEIAITACIFTAWFMKLDSLAGKVAFFAAGFLVGVLMAVFGQTYQTGADPYSLFLGWALLITPWASISRQPGLWLLLAVLLNLTLMLYWEQVINPQMDNDIGQIFGPLFWLFLMMTDYKLAQLVFLLNGVVLIIWEFYITQNIAWMTGRWFPRIIACFALAAIVAATLLFIFIRSFDDIDSLLLLGAIGFAVFIGLSFWYYRKIQHDLFILACCVLSLIVVITSSIARTMEHNFEIAWLVLSLLVIAQTAGGAIWLRNVARDWRTLS